jgi:hypothetical protein
MYNQFSVPTATSKLCRKQCVLKKHPYKVTTLYEYGVKITQTRNGNPFAKIAPILMRRQLCSVPEDVMRIKEGIGTYLGQSRSLHVEKSCKRQINIVDEKANQVLIRVVLNV